MMETPTDAREPDFPNSRASVTAPTPIRRRTPSVARAQRFILERGESSGGTGPCQPQHIDTTGNFAISSLDATHPALPEPVSSQHDGIRPGRGRPRRILRD